MQTEYTSDCPLVYSSNSPTIAPTQAARATRAQALKALTLAQSPPSAEWEDTHVALICHALTHFYRQLPKIAHTRALLETLVGMTKGIDEPLRLFHRDIAAAVFPQMELKAGVRKVRRHLADIIKFQEAEGIELLVYVPGYKSGDGAEAELVPSTFRVPLMWRLTDFLNTSQIGEAEDAFAAVEAYTTTLIAKLRNKPAPHNRYKREQDFDSCVKTAVGWGKRAAEKGAGTCLDVLMLDDAAKAAMLRKAGEEIGRMLCAEAAKLDGRTIWFRGLVDLEGTLEEFRGGVTDDRGVSPVTPEDFDREPVALQGAEGGSVFGHPLHSYKWVTKNDSKAEEGESYPALELETLAMAPDPLPRPVHKFGQPLDEFIERARAAYEKSFSLAELKGKPKGTGAWKQYADCPACGAGREKRGRFNVNTRSGGYKCHACGVKGKLREFWENPPSEWDVTPRPTVRREEIEAKRQAQAEQERTEQAAKIEKARKLYESAAPLAQVPAARDYVEQRTGAADVAERCGVRYALHHRRKAVLFPVVNSTGEVVAINDRRIDGNEDKTRTRGPIKTGVFATPGALDAGRIVIVESPLDAIAAHACGLDAIALCGTSWPEWLPEALESKDVMLGFDNDQPDKHGKRAGDVAATKLANELIGRAPIQRLKPSRKDWSEIAELDGLCALRAELAAALFDSSTLDDECEVMQ